jgi:Recombination endonuclease VII
MDKLCTGPCGQKKPRTEFYKQAKAKDGLQGWCKACVKKRQKETRKPTDPKKQRASNLKKLYGLTIEQWDHMLIAQAGRCALCNDPLLSPHVDHSHDTGEVRGLLCLHCNTMLGRVERLGLAKLEGYLLPKRIERSMTLTAHDSKEALYLRFLSSSYH